MTATPTTTCAMMTAPWSSTAHPAAEAVAEPTSERTADDAADAGRSWCLLQRRGRMRMAEPFAEYLAHPGVNISTLKEIWRMSPKHYQHLLRTPREDSAAFAFGRLVHVRVLEPDTFDERYVIVPRIDRRTKEGKLLAAHFDADVREQISEQFAEQSAAIAEAVRADPVARKYLEGQTEHALYWRDEETRIECKGRVDLLGEYLVGLKTTSDLRPHSFARQAAVLGYHLQWAFYHDGIMAIDGHDIPVVEIVVETSPPYDVMVYPILEDTLDEGRGRYRDALVELAICRDTNEYPGLARGHEVPFCLPRWARAEDDDTLDGLDFGDG